MIKLRFVEKMKKVVNLETGRNYAWIGSFRDLPKDVHKKKIPRESNI